MKDTVSQTREIPQANWNNWALIQALSEAKTPEEIALVRGLIAQRFKETLNDMEDRGPRSFLIIATGGYWGRGKDLNEAAKASKAGRTEKAFAYLVLNDDKPSVDDYGRAHASSVATLISLGAIGTIGAILNANK